MAGTQGSARMIWSRSTMYCQQAGIVPHLVLAGHAHNYQRYTRTNKITAKPATTTFLVAGTGGYGLQAVAAATNAPHPTANAKAAANPPTYNKFTEGVWVLLSLTISLDKIVAEFWEGSCLPGTVRPFNSVSITVLSISEQRGRCPIASWNTCDRMA